MSEDNSEARVEGFGDYHPEAAGHRPYNDAMAAWRNQVRAMQSEGTLPPSQDAPERSEEPEETQDTPEPVTESQPTPDSSREDVPDEQDGPDEPVQELKDRRESEAAYVVERTIDEALDLKEDGTPKEGNPEGYDPAEHNAPEVLEYLKGVGEYEAMRVLELEAQGKARKGILNLRGDILAKARENDETGSGSKSA